jgi:phosphoglycolate phosphatase
MPRTIFRPPLQAAIFDLDGTLVDTLGDFHAALNEMLGALRLPGAEKDVVAGFIGQGSEHLIRSALAHVGGSADLYPRAWEHYQHAYRGLNGKGSTLYPGALEALEALRSAGLRLACVTNKPAEFARELLRAKQVAPLFEQVFGGDSFARKKPDPLPLQKTCEALGAAPAATLMVGDSRYDAAAARAAGCPVLLVTYGYSHGQPVRQIDADGYLDSLAELGAIVRA